MSTVTTQLKQYDNLPEPDEDSYETENKLIKRMEDNYDLRFSLDAAAKEYNAKYDHYLDNALFQEWIVSIGGINDVWCNPPHSKTVKFIKRADDQHKKWNINICMIVPTNVQSTGVWHELIETENTVITENHPLFKRPKFLKMGKKTKHTSRNAYRVIIWRRKK